MLFLSTTSYSQNCQYGQCSQIKSDGYQCKRCVSFGETYCSSHRETLGSPLFTPSTTPANTDPFKQPGDCKYSQCIALKKDGNQCKRCTGGLYESYCSSHK